MNYTICYLEVFDQETNQWEYVPNNQEAEPLNHWYNNLDPFFDNYDVAYLLNAIENKEELALFTKYKGLPTDCSKEIAKAYDFYFHEITMCYGASYCYLSELLDFDYDKTLNLAEIPKKELEVGYPEIFESGKHEISYREWLGENFFIELQQTRQRFSKYVNSRLIYFFYKLDFGL